MFSLTIGGCAIGLAFFLFRPSVCILEEYTPLYLKQIGYSASFIGLAPLLGLFTQTAGIPLLSYLLEKFRARRLFLFLSILTSIPSTLLFFAAKPPKAICDEPKINSTTANHTTSWLNTTDHYTWLPSSSPSLPNKSKNDDDGERLKFFIIFMVVRGIFELSKDLLSH